MQTLIIPIDWGCCSESLFCHCTNKQVNNLISIPELRLYKELYEKWDYREVIIRGWEPLDHPDILLIINYIFTFCDKLTIETNGEKFSDKDFFEKYTQTIDRRNITIKITLYGSHEQLHDRITWWSFLKVIRGIIHLKKHQQKILLHTLVLKQNYRDLDNLASLANKLWLNISFLYTIPDEYLSYKKILPKFSELKNQAHVPIKNVPPCLYNWERNPSKENTSIIHAGSITKYSSNYEESFDSSKKIYLEKCRSCNLRRKCNWVLTEYIHLFWDSEFQKTTYSLQEWHIDLNWYKIENHNHGKPLCKDILIEEELSNHKRLPSHQPLAWSRKINGKIEWFYNYHWALKESHFVGKKIPTINDWMKIFIGIEVADIIHPIGIPLNGYWNTLEQKYIRTWEVAYLWSSSPWDNDEMRFIAIREKDTVVSRWWWEKNHGMSLRFLA